MSVSAAEMESTIRAWAQCINDKKLKDLPDYLHSTYGQNEKEFAPETYATHLVHSLIGAIGDTQCTVDTIFVDQEAQRAAYALYVRSKPSKPFLGYAPTSRGLCLVEYRFVWFMDGKMSRCLHVLDFDGIRSQLSDPDGTHATDLLSDYPAPTITSERVPRQELEGIYRTYIDSINGRRMESDLARFCHAEVTHNGKALTLDEYRILIQESITAIPDLYFRIHTLIVDEESQRVAVRIEFDCTPVKEIKGVVPSGGKVQFAEHVFYQFVDAKIKRVWSIVDWEEARKQSLSVFSSR